MVYDREQAIAYAHQWAFGRNPRYADFSGMGGDCTNFISQCLFAGGAKMDSARTFGWYYYSLSNRAPAWTSVQALYQFLVHRKGPGPSAREILLEEILPGDIIQLSFDGTRYAHSLLVVATGRRPAEDHVLIATHTQDSDYRPLSTYAFSKYRCLKING